MPRRQVMEFTDFFCEHCQEAHRQGDFFIRLHVCFRALILSFQDCDPPPAARVCSPGPFAGRVAPNCLPGRGLAARCACCAVCPGAAQVLGGQGAAVQGEGAVPGCCPVSHLVIAPEIAGQPDRQGQSAQRHVALLGHRAAADSPQGQPRLPLLHRVLLQCQASRRIPVPLGVRERLLAHVPTHRVPSMPGRGAGM